MYYAVLNLVEQRYTFNVVLLTLIFSPISSHGSITDWLVFNSQSVNEKNLYN